MSGISIAALFGKVDKLVYRSMEASATFAKLRGNPYVELVHFLHQLLQLQDSDIHRIIKKYGLDPATLARDLVEALDKLPRGAGSDLSFSNRLGDAFTQAWVTASLRLNCPLVRSGHVLVGIQQDPSLQSILPGISREFRKINDAELLAQFDAIVSGSPEDALVADARSSGGGLAPGESSGAMPPAAMGKGEALKRFTVNLTEKARKGEIDPIVGRDEETRQVVDILMRRRQNNPILTGEAGVGKTAVVEGFALRIASGDVPPPLKNVELHTLDLGLLQAGASMKGEFEDRLRQVIEEVQASPKPIIMFIDEAHQLIGAGGAAGQNDAANLLKPALARGTLRTIAATTAAEYRKYFEKDPALTRRFQVIKVDEPSEAKALLMMRGTANALEKHHKVQLLDEALEAAVKLSHRYIPARQLPDKAVSLIDTACARVAVGQHAVPPELDDCRRRMDGLKTELDILGREMAVGMDHSKRKLEVSASLAKEQERAAELEKRWTSEKGLVDKILAIRARLRGSGQKVEGTGSKVEAAASIAAPAGSVEGELTEADRSKLLDDMKTLQAELSKLQGEKPLILPSVDATAVAAVVADWTGVPVGRMVKNEIESVLHLADALEKRIIGQRHALDAIAKRIRTSRAGLDNPNKPIGVFMLAGTSGVGKTETALTLAETLFGSETSLITINMSEFQEAHKVATLMGSPPGYVGYGEGGVLTEAVRRRPYSVVLLDEIEKAHSDVHEIFFQVFDKGWMKDSEGRDINFRNTIILLTTNAGSDLIMNMCKDPALLPDTDSLAKSLREPLLKVFPAALLGRVVTIPYYPLSDEMLSSIIKLQLGRIAKRVQETHKIPFTYSDEVVKTIMARCTEREFGGRMVDAILTQTILPRMSEEFLKRLIEGRAAQKVHIDVAPDRKDFSYSFE